jgi:phage repressor protein C with HTH and peptisase S24 domain
MFSHDDIWIAIDRLANSAGYSTSGLAKKAGLDPTAFNRSKRMSPEGKPRWPSTESLAKILAVTNITMNDFMTLIEVEILAMNSHTAYLSKTSIPVIGYAQAGQKGYFDDAGYPQGHGWDSVELPFMAPADETTYALKVTGDSMEPLYRTGDILVVSPCADIRQNDRVVVTTKDGQVMAKELLKKDDHYLYLGSLNGSHKIIECRKDNLQLIARILWVSQ